MKKDFTSPQLKKIYDESKKVVESHKIQIDLISDDIRSLEEVLKKAALPFEFRYHIKFDYPKYDNIKRNYELFWKKGRIVYYVWEIYEDYPETVIERPLIETELSTRLSIQDELPFFYKGIMETLKHQPNCSYAETYSPNYPNEKLGKELPF